MVLIASVPFQCLPFTFSTEMHTFNRLKCTTKVFCLIARGGEKVVLGTM